MEKLKELRMSFIVLLIGVFFISGCFFNNTHTVTFKTNGGSEIKEITVKDGQTIKNIQEPKKSGYVFSGWYLDGEEFDENTKIEEDIILVAKWNKVTLSDLDEEETTTTTETTTKKTTTSKKSSESTSKKSTASTKKASSNVVSNTNASASNNNSSANNGNSSSSNNSNNTSTSGSVNVTPLPAITPSSTESTQTSETETTTESTTTAAVEETTTTTTQAVEEEPTTQPSGEDNNNQEPVVDPEEPTTKPGPIVPGGDIPDLPGTPSTPTDEEEEVSIKYGIVVENKIVKIVKLNEEESNINVKVSTAKYNKFLKSDMNNWSAISNNGVKTPKYTGDSTLINFKLTEENKDITSFALIYGNSNEALLFKYNSSTSKWDAIEPTLTVSNNENSLNPDYYVDLKTAIANANKNDVITITSNQSISGSLKINKPIKIIGKSNKTGENVKISSDSGYIFDISNISYNDGDELLIKDIDFDVQSFIKVGNSNFTNIKLVNTKLISVENLYSSDNSKNSDIDNVFTDVDSTGTIETIQND